MIKPTYIDNFQVSTAFDGASRLVLGTAAIGGVWGEVEEAESIDTLLYAWEKGIEAIDTAASYANAQRYIGKALQQWNGKLPYISTKIGRLEAHDPHTTFTDYTPEGLRRLFESNLATLGVDKVDLLFLHEPQLVPIEEMASILEVLHQFKAEGLTAKIGVGGNPTPAFLPFVTRENFDVVSGFLHLDACNLSALDEQIPQFRRENIAYYAASPLHFGLLGPHSAQHLSQEPNEWISQADQEATKAIRQIADNQGLSLISLAHRYLFSIAEADRVVVGAENRSQLQSTLADWEKGKLSREVFEEITELILNAHQKQ